VSPKDKAAAALARKRWLGISATDRTEAMRKVARARWDKATDREVFGGTVCYICGQPLIQPDSKRCADDGRECRK
jgi:hypothetical protein